MSPAKTASSISMDYQQKYDFAIAKLKEFKNFIEVKDLRKFILLVLNLESGGPESILKQLGMGGKGKTVLPFDPQKKVYFAKVMASLSMGHQLTIYHKSDKIHTEFLNKAESPIFTKSLSLFERQNLLPNKFSIIVPETVDASTKVMIGDDSPKKIVVGIEAIYSNLAELIVSQGLKFLFLIEGKSSEPDLVFTINMAIELNPDSPNQIQYFDVYIDDKKKLRDHTFIRMIDSEETPSLEMTFMEEIKEFGHSELYNSHFTIIVPVTSFNALE
jgi:hypothetical protein